MAKRKLRLPFIPVAIAFFLIGWLLYCMGRKRRKA